MKQPHRGGLVAEPNHVEDLTERQLTEKALRASEERYRRIVEMANEGIWQVDAEARTTYVNPRMAEMLGYRVEEMLGRSAFDLVDAADLARAHELWEERRQGLKGVHEFRFRRKDGSSLWASCCVTPLYEEEGGFAGAFAMFTDLTERKRAEELILLQSEIAVNMNEGVCLTRTADARIVYANSKFERIFGYARGELNGQPMSILNAATDRSPEETAQEIIAALEQTGGWRGEIHNVKKDGTPFWTEASISTFEHPQYGRTWIAVQTDITQHKQAKEALRESEERFRQIAEYVEEIFWMLDPVSNQILYVSPAYERIWGRTRESLYRQPRSFLDAIHPQDRPRVRLAVDQQVLRGGSSEEYRIVRPDGSLRWIWDRCFPIRDAQGRLYRLVGIAEDITERKRTEEALRQQRDFAESLLEAARVIVLVRDPEGRIMRFNSYMEEISGYRLDEVQGEDWYTAFVPHRNVVPFREGFQRAVRAGTTLDDTYTIITKAGSQREIEWATKPLRDPSGQTMFVLSIGHDLTALKEAEQQALQSARLAAIGEMVAGLTHESRNALQRSKACLEMLALEIQDRPEALNLVARTKKAQDHLHHLFEEVRNYAAPLKLKRQEADLGAILHEVWNDLASMQRDRHLHLRDRVDGEVDLHCLVDRFAMGQVFRNILENSLGACPDAVEVGVHWSETCIEQQPALLVSLRDNGPGIAPEAREKIFKPFYTTKIHGTGLGMAIARRIVEAHGGRIVVGANSCPGAEILVTVPRGAL